MNFLNLFKKEKAPLSREEKSLWFQSRIGEGIDLFMAKIESTLKVHESVCLNDLAPAVEADIKSVFLSENKTADEKTLNQLAKRFVEISLDKTMQELQTMNYEVNQRMVRHLKV